MLVPSIKQAKQQLAVSTLCVVGFGFFFSGCIITCCFVLGSKAIKPKSLAVLEILQAFYILIFFFNSVILANYYD